MKFSSVPNIFFVIPRMIRGCGWALLGYLRPRVAALAGRWPWPWRALPACEPAPIVALIRQSPTVQNHYVGGQKGPWQVLCIIKSSFRIWKCIMHVTIFAPHHTTFSWILEDLLRENIKRKKTFSFGHCPNHLTPPWPPLEQLGPFFLWRQNSRFESEMWGEEGDILTT